MSVLVDLVNGVIAGVTLTPQTLAANTNTTAIDLANGVIQTFAKIDTGTLAAGVAVTARAQESDTTTSADFTDIPGATFTNTTVSTANTSQIIAFQRGKRYCRLVVTANANAAITASIFAQRKYQALGASTRSGASRLPST